MDRARPARGACAALLALDRKASKRLAHRNLLAIALANKLARIAWAVLARGRDYQPGSPRMPHKIPSLRSTKGMDALPLPPSSLANPLRLGKRARMAPREWLHLTPDEQKKVKGSNIDRFNSFPTEVCEME